MAKSKSSSKGKKVVKLSKKDVFDEAVGSMIINKLPGYFLILCLATAFGFFVYIMSPFLTPIFAAAIFTVAFYPIFKALNKLFRGRSRLASFFTCFSVVVLILAPMVLTSLMLLGETTDLYRSVEEKFESGVFDNYLLWAEGGYIYDFLYDLIQRTEGIVDIESLDLRENILNMVQNISSFIGRNAATLFSSVTFLVVSLVVMLFSMYYFFKDGKKIVEKIGVISPLPSVYESELFAKIHSMVKAIVFGVFLTAILQGVAGGIGFAIAGLSSPVFWGTIMSFASLIPVVGTTLIWVPAVIILLALGNYGAAVFLLIWGTVVIGSVDNIIRPYLIGGKAKTYPLLTFVVILGGIFVMGFKGLIVGPLVLIILMSLLEIYQAEYSRVLKD